MGHAPVRQASGLPPSLHRKPPPSGGGALTGHRLVGDDAQDRAARAEQAERPGVGAEEEAPLLAAEQRVAVLVAGGRDLAVGPDLDRAGAEILDVDARGRDRDVGRTRAVQGRAGRSGGVVEDEFLRLPGLVGDALEA